MRNEKKIAKRNTARQLGANVVNPAGYRSFSRKREAKEDLGSCHFFMLASVVADALKVCFMLLSHKE